MTPGTLNLTVQRNVPFLDTIIFEGYDFTGATFALEVRSYRGATGAALLTLAGATAGSQGISVTVAEVDGVDVSTLLIQIDEATIDALLAWPANGQKAGSVLLKLSYDLIITGGGVGKTRWLQGDFSIEEGVTV